MKKNDFIKNLETTIDFFKFCQKSRLGNNFGIILYASYIIFLGLLGQIGSGVLWADLLLGFIFIYVLNNLKVIPRRVFYAGLFLILYTVLASIFSVVLNKNSVLHSALLTARTGSFVLLFYFGLVLKFKNKNSNFLFPLKIVVLAAIAVTIKNYYIDERAYYGYAQIMSSSAPAISGFFLGAISIFFISYKKSGYKPVRSSFLFGIISLVLTLLVFSLSSLFGLVFALIFYYLLLIALPKVNSIHKLIVALGLLVSTAGVFVFHNKIIAIFWRLTRLFDKLEYRLDKVSFLINDICKESISCLIGGAGPGAHSFYNSVGLGEGSILAFDQLYGRIVLEWGVLGSFFWLSFLIFAIKPIIINKSGVLKINLQVFTLVVFGLLFGVGSEFVFVSFSGSIFAILLGLAQKKKVPVDLLYRQ